MGGACASLTQGILAYNNIDLIANGYINETDNDRRGNQIRLLPSNRLSIEFQYSVRSDITGTSLNSLSPGGNAGFIFGTLGGGAGFGIASALGCSLLGDIEPTRSQFIFHVCLSETRINRSIPVTQEMLDQAKSNNGLATYQFLNEYPIAFLGITKSVIRLTADEIAAIGSGGGTIRGHHITPDGLIEAQFQSYGSADDANLFRQIVRDPRKFLYRADNNTPGDPLAGANAFLSGSGDDLTDRTISFQLTKPSQTSPPEPDPKVGDLLYLTYVVAKKRYVRQAIFVSSFFFLFPNFVTERIGVDQVRAWNFAPMTFRAQKKLDKKTSIADLIHDDAILSDNQLSDAQKAAQTRLDTIEGQRLIEVLTDNKTQTPYIRGIYFADSRGILSLDYRGASQAPQLLVPASDIRDQPWWTAFIASYMDGGPGFDGNGELDPKSEGASRLLQGFAFDVSDHVNSVCYDNDKFGYQRQLADALKSVSSFDPSNTTSGVGFPNLDLLRQRLPQSAKYDLSSAKFSTIKMSSTNGGAYFVRDCNKIFTYDQQFCSSGTLQADMFIRTPFFFVDLPRQSRIYVERFTPQFALAPDGGIWVATSPTLGDSMSIDTHPYKNDAFLVFNKDSRLNYQRYSDAFSKIDTSYTESQFDPNRNHNAPSLDTLTQEDISVIGYDKTLGNQPGYSRGLEITTEGGKIQLGKLPASSYQTTEVQFVQNTSNGNVTVTGLGNKKVRTLRLKYVPTSEDFLLQKERSLTFIYPGSKLVIDNVALPFEGLYREDERLLSFDTRYYSDESIRINGNILQFMKIKKIEIVYLADQAYTDSSVTAGNPSAVFDAQGRLYVFYEDQKAHVGSYNGGDESLANGGYTEISCLISPDMGYTWFDYKGIIRTAGTETVRNPFAVCNKAANVIHLMYVHNDTLMHKGIQPSLFDVDDAFVAYRRPQTFNDTSPDDFGLAQFSDKGKHLRQVECNIAIGNLSQESWISGQRSIDDIRKTNKLRPRFSIGGDFQSFAQGFAETDFIVLLDRKNTIKVLYASNGQFFARLSNSGGTQWNDVFPKGLPIHKTSTIQEPRPIIGLGYAMDDESNILHLSYTADGMLFVKSMSLGLFEQKQQTLIDTLNPESENAEPLFVVGQMSEDAITAIRSNKTHIVYPYPIGAIDSFDQRMSISETGARGFVGASGLTRIFYTDGNGEIRAFSLTSDDGPLLDVKRKARS